MNFTPQEKLILVMLCDIYDKLGISGEVDHKLIKRSIFSDNTWSIPWEMPGIFGDEQFDDPAEVKEVSDVLDMWSQLEASYSHLSPEGKALVKQEAAPFGENVRFPGFDGNREARHFNVANHLVKEMGRWSEFSEHDLNSHAPSLEAYGRMLAVFEHVRESNHSDLLSAQEIIKILKARMHPSHR